MELLLGSHVSGSATLGRTHNLAPIFVTQIYVALEVHHSISSGPLQLLMVVQSSFALAPTPIDMVDIRFQSILLDHNLPRGAFCS